MSCLAGKPHSNMSIEALPINNVLNSLNGKKEKGYNILFHISMRYICRIFISYYLSCVK